MAIGWALLAHPLNVNRVWPGIACDIQGFFINTGDVASTLWSLVIALHTCFLLAGGQKLRAWATEKSTTGKERWIICISIWAFVFLLGFIGPLVIERVVPENGPFCIGL
jgi:hypothetical protein